MTKKEIGQRIRGRRMDLEMTVGDLALDTGLSQRTIQNYELGQFDQIQPMIIYAIADRLNISPSWLLGTATDRQVTQEDLNLIHALHNSPENIQSSVRVLLGPYLIN